MENKTIITYIKRILSGSSSKEEEAEVDHYFYESLQSEEWDEEKLGSRADLEQRILDHVDQGISAKEIETSKRSVFKKYAQLAAILTLFALAGFLGRQYLKTEKQNDTNALNQLLQPGSDIASLALSDGTILSLADLEIGEQYSSTSFVVKKTEEGNLEYVYSENQADTRQEEKWNTLKTPRGGKYQIVLADGTKVWLNAQSTLTFPDHFSGNQRVVEANGEVYFEVSPDQAKPFIVHTTGMDIRVVGTSFNLSAYEENSLRPTVSLIEGSVQVKAGLEVTTLIPGQKATLDKEQIGIGVFDEESEIAWKNNYFIFKDRNIKEIMAALARWYDAEIEYQGEGWDDKNFTVRISRREGIEEILSLIELTQSIKFKIEGRRVIVSA